MGPRRLRPVTLPHHRTCGFPHPAVEQGGFLFSCFREVPWYDEPTFAECFGFQCGLHDYVPGDCPCPKPTVGHTQNTAFDSQPLERVDAPSRMVPSLPEAFAHVAAYPSAQVVDFPRPVGKLEVVPPSSNVALPLFAQFFAGFALPRRPLRSTRRWLSPPDRPLACFPGSPLSLHGHFIEHFLPSSFRASGHLLPTPALLATIHPLALLSSRGGAADSCCSLHVSDSFPPPLRSPVLVALSVVLRPFAPPAFRQASSLLRPLLTSPALSRRRSPRVRCMNILFGPVPSGST